MADNIRVRFPPSPTGIPHIGNTRTALFNYLFAKHHKGAFILRIEDTDRARLVPGAEEKIKEILKWLGLTWDEFYKQSERLPLYKEAVEELLKKGLARKDEGAVRFIIPKGLPAGRQGETVSWKDGVGDKEISFKSEDLEDFVILKSDGFPTYHLANVVDDHDMKISHVIRGDEWISSVPKHILLYKAFGWEHPAFVHLPVIVGSDKAKLSKRHGAESVLEYRDRGYLKEALLNFMALLGWNPGGDKEIMSMDEMIKLFDLKDVNTASPMFDVKKLDWMNGMYIRQLKADELVSSIKYQVLSIKDIDAKILEKIVPLAQSRLTTLNDFAGLVEPFFVDIQSFNLSEDEKNAAKRLSDCLKKVENWNIENILSALQTFCQEEKANMKLVYRILTGKNQGLPLSDTLAILGRDQTLTRLKNP